MICTAYYRSPLGKILLASDEEGLIGLWFENQKYYADILKSETVQEKNDILRQAEEWLDIYFSGREPEFTPPLHMTGSAFRKSVWDILLTIPYGQTRTYGDIAKQLAAQNGWKKMSAQAVGGAVGHNAISVIIPCHRVVGANGSLPGYAGGIERKVKLLALEKAIK